MKYRKKPVEVEAVQWNGENVDEIKGFCPENAIIFHDLLLDGVRCDKYSLSILTLEGVMSASVGDYIIKGIQGEFYPCKEDIFIETYEEVSTTWETSNGKLK